MKEVNLQSKKLELIQWLDSLTDLSVIEKIAFLKKQEEEDWWDSTSEAEKKSINQGLRDAEDGKLIDHEEAKKIYQKWL
jgi:predicted transcriptional regulator